MSRTPSPTPARPSLPPPDAHRRLAASADGWFGRARAALLGSLPCQSGCARCCIGPFAITRLDLHALAHAMRTLPSGVAEGIRATARRQIAIIETAYPRLRDSPILDRWPDQDLDTLTSRFADLPCPALDTDGRCRVYEARPITCRQMGIPVESDGHLDGACSVQTFVPIVRLSSRFREEERRLAELEAQALEREPEQGEEWLITYGFLD